MFDRIARVYDRMNGLMTVGMHHRWRERAVDLAAWGRARGRSTWPPAPATWRWRCRRAARRWWRWTSPSGCSRSRATKAPGIRFEAGNALALPYADGEFDAVTVGFGARNFSDLARGLARDGARHAARRPRGGARDHHPAEAAAVLVLPALVRPGGAAPRPAGGRLRRLHLPAELGAPLPRSRGAGGRAGGGRAHRRPLGAHGRRHHRAARRPKASCAAGRPAASARRRDRRPGTARGRAGRRRPAAGRGARAHRGAPGRGGGRARGGAGGPRAGMLAAGGKRLRPMLVFLAAADDSDPRLVSAGVAVELLHMATLVHDDVLDRAPLRRGRPDRVRRRRAARRPPRPATCSSRARSRSWPARAATRR